MTGKESIELHKRKAKKRKKKSICQKFWVDFYVSETLIYVHQDYIYLTKNRFFLAILFKI